MLSKTLHLRDKSPNIHLSEDDILKDVKSVFKYNTSLNVYRDLPSVIYFVRAHNELDIVNLFTKKFSWIVFG